MNSVMWHLVPTEREDSLHKGTFHLYTEVAAARCSSLQQPSPVTTYSLWHKTLIWKFKSVQVAKYGSSLSLFVCKVQHRWAVALLAKVARCNEKNLLYFCSHLPISTPFWGICSLFWAYRETPLRQGVCSVHLMDNSGPGLSITSSTSPLLELWTCVVLCGHNVTSLIVVSCP